jgi:hypothetical protein
VATAAASLPRPPALLTTDERIGPLREQAAADDARSGWQRMFSAVLARGVRRCRPRRLPGFAPATACQVQRDRSGNARPRRGNVNRSRQLAHDPSTQAGYAPGRNRTALQIDAISVPRAARGAAPCEHVRAYFGSLLADSRSRLGIWPMPRRVWPMSLGLSKRELAACRSARAADGLRARCGKLVARASRAARRAHELARTYLAARVASRSRRGPCGQTNLDAATR